MSADELSTDFVRALRAMTDENEQWEWQAPVGPGNASYANGYENGRRAVGADLRRLIATLDEASRPPACGYPEHEHWGWPEDDNGDSTPVGCKVCPPPKPPAATEEAPAPSPCTHGRRFCEQCHGEEVL